jgi:hypothetical protein
VLINLRTKQQNAFWELGPSGDPYRALSFDLGHVVPGGVIKHILLACYDRLSMEGRDKATLTIIDDRYVDLNHQMLLL